ncbi:MAG: asparaginase [Hyphomicrobiaceae bacterium]|nr:asparaginase [Hyphomicrobiaceae bacterium]
MANPVLVETLRGELVESRHRGSIAVAGPDGRLAFASGEVRRPVFPRSAIKSIQCLPLIETGAADRFGFGAAEIALACASHSGTERHVAVAAGMLARAGLDEAALACGSHEPLAAAAARTLIQDRQPPSPLHNNCSGKHAGMLATAVHMSEPVADYWRPEHPVQVRIAAALEDLTGTRLGTDRLGIDGCSAPNWAIPLADLARAFARLITGEGLSPARRAAAERVLESCWAEPELVSGPERLDTELMTRLRSALFLKTGAEGVYCGAIPARGLGFALKVDDGAKRASELAVKALTARLVPQAGDLPLQETLRNWRGLPAAGIRCSAELLESLGDAGF